MTKYDENWVAAEEAKRQWLAENGLYKDDDEHASGKKIMPCVSRFIGASLELDR